MLTRLACFSNKTLSIWIFQSAGLAGAAFLMVKRFNFVGKVSDVALSAILNENTSTASCRESEREEILPIELDDGTAKLEEVANAPPLAVVGWRRG